MTSTVDAAGQAGTHAVTAVTAVTIVGHVADVIPTVAATIVSCLAIIWYSIVIWESRTVSRWRGKDLDPDS